MKEVILAKSAGFCFGVKRAVDTVYEQTGKKNVYTFGPIIHNEEVVKDLEKKGVFVINTMEELDDITEGTVIIRSHGVSSAVYEALQKKGVEIVDATCPFVLKIHNIVKQESANGKQIVIIGNEKHPEVEGIMGWSKTQVHVVDTAEKDGFVSSGDNNLTVVLDTNLTPELVEEGFVREIVSKVQTMRKEADFNVTDRIRVYYDGNAKIAEILAANDIKGDVLAVEVVAGKGGELSKEWNINGEKVTLGVARV